jgi:voltage-gated potassium channel
MADINPATVIERRITRYMREPVSVRNAVSVIVVTTLMLVVAGGILIRVIDHHEYSTVWVGMWWALQTVTTVGYGDVTPVTTAGRAVGAVVMLEGIAFLAIVTAAITSTFIGRVQERLAAKGEAEEERAEERLNARLDDLAGRLERMERMLLSLTER